MTISGFGTRIEGTRGRAVATVAVMAIQVAITVPFLWIAPSTLRGVPGPLLIVVSVTAAFLLGPYVGMALSAFAVVLAWWILDVNPYIAPLVWLSMAALAGVVGDRARRGEALRRDVLDELRAGLVALSDDPQVRSARVITRYIPAVQSQVLAADFYGVLPASAGAVAVLVGDVAGHGPAAAAIATHLRAAWRALVMAGVPAPRIMGILNETLLAERHRTPAGPSFATICLASVAPDQRVASLVVAGHPPPVLVAGDGAAECRVASQPAIGISPSASWNAQDVALPADAWSLLFYTDGLVEGRAQDGTRPLGIDRLLPDLASCGPLLVDRDLDALLADVEGQNGGSMMDDIVLVAVTGNQDEG